MPIKGGVRDEWARGAWPLLAAFIGMMMATGPLFQFSVGVFMEPLHQAFGWSRFQISMSITILYAGVTVAAPLVGYCIDRWSTRLVIVISGIAAGISYLMLGMMRGGIYEFYGIMLAMSLLAAGCSTVAFSRVINVYFDKMRGTANALGLSGSGLASTFSPALLSLIIRNEGWRTAYFALAAFVFAVLPIIWLLLGSPDRGRAKAVAAGREAEEELSGLTFAEAMQTRLPWLLWVAVFLVSTCIGGIVVHFVPMIVQSGIPVTEASAMAGLIGSSMAISRLASGITMDRVFAPHIGAVIFGLGCAGCVALAFGGVWGAAAGAIAIGLCAGTEIDLLGYLTARYFGMRAFGRLYGLIFTAATAGAAGSAPVYGYVADRTGGYFYAVAASAVLLAIAAMLMLALPRFPRFPPRPSRAATAGGA